MMDIPLSSVIVRDQPNFSDTLESPSSLPKTIGLGPLMSANKLCIKQRIRASDVLSLLTGCEVTAFGIAPFQFS